MGMYVCGPCMSEHELETEDTSMKLGAMMLLGCGDTVGGCEICGPMKNDWSNKRLRWTDAITRRCDGRDRKANVIQELTAFKTWKAGGCVGKY